MNFLHIPVTVSPSAKSMAAIPKTILIALAVIAVGASQVLGFARGFLCACSGHELLTGGADCTASGCHDDDEHHDHGHGGICPADDGESGDGDHHDQDSPHRHQPVKETLVGTSFVPLALVLPPDPGLDLSTLFAQDVRMAAMTAERMAELQPPENSGMPPPSGILVARTMVMLI
jgi:hypothetical protein